MKFYIWAFFEKLLRKIQASLESDKDNGHFTWTPMYIYDGISLSFSYNEKFSRQNSYRKTKHTFRVQYRFSENFSVYEIMWKNNVKADRPQITVWRMRFVCWRLKATVTHWEYVILICGLVVRVSGYRYRGLGFDSRRYQIFWVVVCLERGPLSLVRSIEELLE